MNRSGKQEVSVEFGELLDLRFIDRDFMQPDRGGHERLQIVRLMHTAIVNEGLWRRKTLPVKPRGQRCDVCDAMTDIHEAGLCCRAFGMSTDEIEGKISR